VNKVVALGARVGDQLAARAAAAAGLGGGLLEQRRRVRRRQRWVRQRPLQRRGKLALRVLGRRCVALAHRIDCADRARDLEAHVDEAPHVLPHERLPLDVVKSRCRRMRRRGVVGARLRGQRRLDDALLAAPIPVRPAAEAGHVVAAAVLLGPQSTHRAALDDAGAQELLELRVARDGLVVRVYLGLLHRLHHHLKGRLAVVATLEHVANLADLELLAAVVGRAQHRDLSLFAAQHRVLLGALQAELLGAAERRLRHARRLAALELDQPLFGLLGQGGEQGGEQGDEQGGE